MRVYACKIERKEKKEGETYLCNGLFIPHGCLFDKVLHFNVPISTRNDHARPPETHRHFHVSSAAVNPKEEKAASERRRQPSRVRACGRVNEWKWVKVKRVKSPREKSLFVVLPSTQRRSGQKLHAQDPSGGAGWRPPSCRATDSLNLPESSQRKKPSRLRLHS